MFKKIKRLRKAWNLAAKDVTRLDSLTDKQIDALPNTGDGNAVFISSGSEQEYKEFEKEEKGFKGLFGL